ncbi:MAG: alpha-L-arabinofuranosidase C-terminal domain-containing protein [Anaerolineae bacterium]
MVQTNLLTHLPVSSPDRANIRVDARTRAAQEISPKLFGKFCEHLGANIYHGMEAQILFNCTFGKWRFSAAHGHPDGGVQAESEPEEIAGRIARRASRYGWPDPQPVIEAYFGGGAYGWFTIGEPEDVRLSPDAGPHGDRAQRVEITRTSPSALRGIGQWIYLPLHRTPGYEFRLVARSVEPCELMLSLRPVKGSAALTQTGVSLNEDWQTIKGTLKLPEDALSGALYRFALTAEEPADIVIDRVLLYPDDHINGADPDIILMLKEAHLPLLRWPGGNFVSGYRWRDGVGPVDARPTYPNPAWEGLEFNLFGTDEFIALCRAVGCEPMICINAGDGTPEEAAAWVEYCNGGPVTPMGSLRAANGHPEPYGVKLWEIGNEIYGHWQVNWTTPSGNVDRYRRFREVMLAVDPTLHLLGCGHGNEPNSEWNHRLIEGAGDALCTITDHILTGGSVHAETDPAELYQAFMGYPAVLMERYRALEASMREAGIEDPHLAITELQLFAHFRGETAPEARLKPEMVPSPDTVAEALSLTLIVNTCVRLGDFVEMLTHSATVNHGGGLRKEREVVYANPVHYAHVLGHALAGATPVAVQLSCDTFSTQHTFGHIPPLSEVPIIDAMAALSKNGDLILTLVHRAGDVGPVGVAVSLEGFAASDEVGVITLRGKTWHDRNTLDEPDRVGPQKSQIELTAPDRLDITLPPFSVTQVKLTPA